MLPEVLRDQQRVDSYAAAWDEWEGTDDAVLWEAVTRDGVKPHQGAAER